MDELPIDELTEEETRKFYNILEEASKIVGNRRTTYNGEIKLNWKFQLQALEGKGHALLNLIDDIKERREFAKVEVRL